MKALLVSAAAVGLLTAAPAFAQSGPVASTNANATATVVQPIAVTNVDGLNFGKIAATAGTVTVAPDGTPSSSPNMIVDSTGIGAADFTVTGESGLAYTASLASPNATLTDGTNTMSVSLTLSTEPMGGWIVGTNNFSVGGVLTVANGQVPGSYATTFGVNVQYD